jgi:hypothetical protein
VALAVHLTMVASYDRQWSQISLYDGTNAVGAVAVLDVGDGDGGDNNDFEFDFDD